MVYLEPGKPTPPKGPPPPWLAEQAQKLATAKHNLAEESQHFNTAMERDLSAMEELLEVPSVDAMALTQGRACHHSWRT